MDSQDEFDETLNISWQYLHINSQSKKKSIHLIKKTFVINNRIIELMLLISVMMAIAIDNELSISIKCELTDNLQ